MKDLMLAIDIGTTNVKSVIARRDMTVLGQAESEYRTHAAGIARFEQDCEDWWNHALRAIAKAFERTGASPADVAAVAVSSQAPSMQALDAQGRSLYPALIWMDRRSGAQCREMEARLGKERVYALTGNAADPFYTFGEVLWLRENCPAEFARVYSILQCNGYVNYRLTGEHTIDRTHASITQCYDVRRGDWCGEMLDAFGVDRGMLPRVVDCGEVIGGVNAAASRETGIPEGTPVLGGAVDGAAAALEGGLTRNGVAVEMSGTSSVLLVGSEEMHTSPNLTYMYSAIPGQHLLLGCMSCTGGALKWYRDNVYADRSEGCYEAMNREILRDCPDPAGVVFLPYLSGERAPIWDTHAKGAFLGLRAGTAQGELLRAMQEGAAFALMDNLREARRAGANIETLRAVGGSTRSDIWMRIKASVTGLPIEIPRTSLGAPGGLLALLARHLKEFDSVEQACGALVKIDRVVEPEPAWTAWYQEQFELFKQYYRQIRDCFRQSDALRQRYGFGDLEGRK